MAESPAEPPDDPDERSQYWTNRINDYFQSPQAQANFQAGFASQSQFGQFLDLDGFKKREAEIKRHGFADSQGQLHQGSTSGDAVWPPKKEKLKGGHHNPIVNDFGVPKVSRFAPKCKSFKHNWVGDPTAFVFICQECGLERRVSEEGAVQYKFPQVSSGSIAAQEALDPFVDWTEGEDEEEATRMCLWCGKVCESLDALDLHEAECEP